MTTSIRRAQFLRGDFNGRRSAPRPPWALPFEAFYDRCTRCDACRSACPRGLIRPGVGGFPAVVFDRAACNFCAACVAACTTGALNPTLAGSAPWTVKAHIEDHCLSVCGVLCRVCAEHCEARAIRFRPSVGGRAQPLIDAIRCTGCGACRSVCPERAVVLIETAAAPVT